MTCEKCNMVFNEFYNSKEIELHPCGKSFLIKRKDDNYDTLMSRFDTYMEITKPVLDYYANKQGFHEIDGALKIDEITSKIGHILNV